MTVSLALRKSERVAERTRLAVEDEAAKQNYALNPLIGAYMAGVRRGQVAGYSPSIAYISGTNAALHRRTPHLSQLLQGVRARTRTLGFKLREYFGAGAASPWDRLAQELGKSPTVGLILAPFPPSAPEVALPWERFCCVAVGHAATRPAMHTVTDEKLRICRAVLSQLELDGINRLGFVSFHQHEALHSHGLVAAFLDWQESIETSRRIPLLRLNELGNCDRLHTWIQKHSPSVVLSPLDLSAAFSRPGISRINFVQLCMSRGRKKKQPKYGSIEPNNEVGVAAVDMLAGLIYRHETGLPAKPCVVEVPGILCGYDQGQRVTAWS